jgi:hypothetical protein
MHGPTAYQHQDWRWQARAVALLIAPLQNALVSIAVATLVAFAIFLFMYLQ